MKITQIAGVLAGLWLCLNVSRAQTVYNDAFNVNLSVPDASYSGLMLSTNLSGMNGYITGLTVSLDISGGFNGDLYAYLTGPNGGFAVLLNRVGVTNGNAHGYSDAGFNLTLSDTGANSIHYYQLTSGVGVPTGTWAPDGENVDPLSAGVGSTASTATLSSLYGTNPNGTWTLFIADLSAGGTSLLNDWQLSITTVPEPGTLALGVTAGLALLGARRWRRTA